MISIVVVVSVLVTAEFAAPPSAVTLGLLSTVTAMAVLVVVDPVDVEVVVVAFGVGCASLVSSDATKSS